MQRTFSYILLITWIFLASGCTSHHSAKLLNAENIRVSSSAIPSDSQIIKIYLPYKEIVDKEMSTVISETTEEMVKDKPESALTNFLADLLLDQSAKIARENGWDIQPDISYFNYGGIRTFLPKGEITIGKIYELMPFENEMVYLRLSGEKVQQFLDIIAKKGGDSLGGVRFTISGEKAKNVTVRGEPIVPGKYYWLATNSYIALGGDDLDIMTEHSEMVESGEKIRNIIISCLMDMYDEGEIISAKPDGRICYEQKKIH